MIKNKKPILHSKIIKDIVLKKCKGKCSYCGIKLTRTGKNITTDYTVDHITPTKRSKIDNDLSNLTAVCHSCNSKKKDKTLDQYIAYLKEKGLLNKQITAFYGGYITRIKHGNDYYSKIARKRWSKIKSRK